MKIKKVDTNYIFNCIVLFFFLYDIALTGFTTKLSSRKWAFLIMMLIFLWKYQCLGIRKHILTNQIIRQCYFFEIFVTLFSVGWLIWRMSVNNLSSNNKIVGANGIYFLLFALLASIFISYMFRDLREFLNALITVSMLQSILIFFEGASSTFKNWLEFHIYNQSIGFSRTVRATGIGASGSWVSILIFFGIFSAGFFIFTEKFTAKYWFKVIVMMIAQFLTGKTGLFLGILYLAYILIKKNKRMKVLAVKTIKHIFIGILIGIIAVTALNLLKSNIVEDLIVHSFHRLFALDAYITDTGGGFFGAFLGMKIPPISCDTFWGYGISKGVLGFRHDSGYVNRYIADGLLMAGIEYLALFLLMIVIYKKIENKKIRQYVLWLIPCMFGIEIKEAYFYQYVAIAIVLSILMLSKNSKETSKVILKECA